MKMYDYFDPCRIFVLKLAQKYTYQLNKKIVVHKLHYGTNLLYKRWQEFQVFQQVNTWNLDNSRYVKSFTCFKSSLCSLLDKK